MSYNREVNLHIGQEVVIQARQVGPAARYEGERGLYLEGNDILAVDDLEDLLARLGDLVAQGGEVLDDLGGAPDGGGGGDVVQRGALGEQRRVWRGQELLIRRRHCCSGSEAIAW